SRAFKASGSLGEHADGDPEALKALDLAIDGAETENMRIQSDGSVVLVMSASLDGLAGRTPVNGQPRFVIDGKKHGVAPALGYRLVSGTEEYAGPVRFARTASGKASATVTRAKGDEL